MHIILDFAGHMAMNGISDHVLILMPEILFK